MIRGDLKVAARIRRYVVVRTARLAMKRYRFHLRISPDRYLNYYRGTVRRVIVRCTSGETVEFPASLLQRFVTVDGIQGDFTLTCDEKNAGAALERVG